MMTVVSLTTPGETEAQSCPVRSWVGRGVCDKAGSSPLSPHGCLTAVRSALRGRPAYQGPTGTGHHSDRTDWATAGKATRKWGPPPGRGGGGRAAGLSEGEVVAAMDSEGCRAAGAKAQRSAGLGGCKETPAREPRGGSGYTRRAGLPGSRTGSCLRPQVPSPRPTGCWVGRFGWPGPHMGSGWDSLLLKCPRGAWADGAQRARAEQQRAWAWG